MDEGERQVTGLEHEDERTLLVRIDERLLAVQKAVEDINETRQCDKHAERIKILERMVWGCMFGLGGLGLQALLQMLKH